MTVYFSAEAERDIETIGDYIARDDPARAMSFLGELRVRCLGLATMPRRFPLVSRYEASGVRRCVHGAYLIFYKESDEGIVILHILHGAQEHGAPSCFRADPARIAGVKGRTRCGSSIILQRKDASTGGPCQPFLIYF